MTFTPKTVNGETVFEISKDTSRYIIFFYTQMNFNSIGNNNTSDTWNLNITLLEKKDSVEENDLVPDIKRFQRYRTDVLTLLYLSGRIMYSRFIR